MKNTLKTFTLFVRSDKGSTQIANAIRKLNKINSQPLQETNDGDLIIAIGGDGTFIDSVTTTNFSQSKIYVGIHTGTLGFLQNVSANEVFALIKYLNQEKEIQTRQVAVASVSVLLSSGKILHYKSLNEVLIVGDNYSKISFSEYVNNEFLQNVTGNGIVISTNTGDTAYSRNLGGAIIFSDQPQLVCTLETPILNAAYERFITNPVVTSNVSIVINPSNNIRLIIDGIPKDIEIAQIQRVDVSIDGQYYINKFDTELYSKVNAIRQKLLGYDF